MGEERSLGIADVVQAALAGQNPARSDHWYWCRRHEKAEHSSEPTRNEELNSRGEWRMFDCIRVGPFMSETEANRLGSQWGRNPLGMEVVR